MPHDANYDDADAEEDSPLLLPLPNNQEGSGIPSFATGVYPQRDSESFSP